MMMYAKSFVLFLLFATGLTCMAAQGEANNETKIAEAIEKGAAYLKQEQKSDGSWSTHLVFDVTPLCTLALLSSGVASDDVSIQRALTYLRNHKPKRNYTKVVALSTMVFCKAEPDKDADRIKRNVELLVEHQYQEGEFVGGWRYLLEAASDKARGDPANTEWALLALDRAHSVGNKIEQTVWRNSLQFWQSRQNPDGSWKYHHTQKGTGSMTCAGLASLLIIKNKLQEPADEITATIARGMTWLEKNFTVRRNPPRERIWHLYYLYGLSRTAQAQNLRLIGERDWYQEAAETLLEKQDPKTGTWKDLNANNLLTDTSFALLFLSSGVKQ